MIAMIVSWAALVHAGTKRVAVIVGNNVGNTDQIPLHYAETDASEVLTGPDRARRGPT